VRAAQTQRLTQLAALTRQVGELSVSAADVDVALADLRQTVRDRAAGGGATAPAC